MHNSFINDRDHYKISFPKGVPHFVSEEKYKLDRPLMRDGEVILYSMSGLLVGEEDNKWFCFRVKDDHHEHVAGFFEGKDVEDIDDDMFDCYEIEITSPLHEDFKSLYNFDLETKALFTFANHDIYHDDHYILEDLHLKIYKNINIRLDFLRYDCNVYIIKTNKINKKDKYFKEDEERVMIFKFKGVDAAIFIHFKYDNGNLYVDKAEYIDIQIDDEIGRISSINKNLEKSLKLISRHGGSEHDIKMTSNYREIKQHIKSSKSKPCIEFYSI